MPYTYPIDPAAMFKDRYAQMLGFGFPQEDVNILRENIRDMWLNAPGGWVYEWSTVAARYASMGNPYLSALAYGWAKFPCLADEAKVKAMQLQVQKYIEASKNFPVKFERRSITVPYAGGTTDVFIHLLGGPDDRKHMPVLLASGGVDSWKMDIHHLLVALAQGTGMTVMAFDHPGTGETKVPLNRAGDEVVLGLADAARAIGNGRVAHFGLSFGGNFTAMTGLSGAVDAAIDLGGPVNATFERQNLKKMPYGMADIVGNDLGFNSQPDFDKLADAAAGLSRAALLNNPSNAPMLVINGEDDYFVPREDTTIFNGRLHTQVHLLPGTGHCAVSRMNEVMPVMFGWLRNWAASN